MEREEDIKDQFSTRLSKKFCKIFSDWSYKNNDNFLVEDSRLVREFLKSYGLFG